MSRFNENDFKNVCKKINDNLERVYQIYSDLLHGNFSWALFIEYQNILMDSLYEEKKAEITLKKIRKDVRKGLDKSVKEEHLNYCIDKLQFLERNIKIFGDFLCWTFYKNDQDLIDEHIKKKTVNINSFGSGIVAEIELLRKINVPENPEFYIYNAISSFLRIGDLSIFDKYSFRIVGLGEIKSSVPENGQMKVSLDMIVKNNNSVYYPKNMHAKVEEDKTFLNEEMLSHLKQQVEEMKSSFNPQNLPKKIDKEVASFHFEALKKVIEECDINNAAYVKVSDDILYVAAKNEYENSIDYKKIIPKDVVEKMLVKNPLAGQNQIGIQQLNLLSDGKNLPYLYYPIPIDTLKKGLNQTISIVYSFNKVVEEFNKLGFEYTTKKKIPFLQKKTDQNLIKVDLRCVCDYYINMFLDENGAIDLIKTMLDLSDDDSLPPNRKIFVNVKNTMTKKSKATKKENNKK